MTVFQASLPTIEKTIMMTIRVTNPSLTALITSRSSRPVTYLVKRLFESRQEERNRKINDENMELKTHETHDVENYKSIAKQREVITPVVKKHA